MNRDFSEVTEVAGERVTQEQIDRLCDRYYWAAEFVGGLDVLEVGCGTGQGLGLLLSRARTVHAVDISWPLLTAAQRHYRNRIAFQQVDAENLPFVRDSKDVIILFEALYYLPNANRFVEECHRVLRPDGKVLVTTANKDLYDFSPSQQSSEYYGAAELHQLFEGHGFKAEIFGDTAVDSLPIRQSVLRPLKRAAVRFGLMPRAKKVKRILKRIVFGKLVTMPQEIQTNTTTYRRPTLVTPKSPNPKYKVLYCAATLLRNNIDNEAVETSTTFSST